MATLIFMKKKMEYDSKFAIIDTKEDIGIGKSLSLGFQVGIKQEPSVQNSFYDNDTKHDIDTTDHTTQVVLKEENDCFLACEDTFEIKSEPANICQYSEEMKKYDVDCKTHTVLKKENDCFCGCSDTFDIKSESTNICQYSEGTQNHDNPRSSIFPAEILNSRNRTGNKYYIKCFTFCINAVCRTTYCSRNVLFIDS